MRLEPASRGAVVLRLPARIRGLLLVELKPSLLAATMASLEPSDVALLLGSLDAADGDRFKAFSLFHDGFAGQLLRALTARERASLMGGMRVKEQARVLALMTTSTERGLSLKALPMEVQVALLSAIPEADRREAL
jgi:Mg/Co/Ni transporter MgtE